jgi:large subunit ribosomal protein L10
MSRLEKDSIIQSVSDGFTKSAIALLVDYQGLNVKQTTNFRKKIGEVGGKARIVKNSLLRKSFARAFDSTYENDVESISDKEKRGFLDLISGPTMVVVGLDDPVAPTKVLVELQEKLEFLKVRGGFLDGEFLTIDRVDQLSKLPGKSEVLSQLLRTLLAPATNLVRLINEPGSQLARVIKAHSDNLNANTLN